MTKKVYLIIGLIFFNTVSRLIPHPPNMTSLVTMSLFTGKQLTRRMALMVLFSSLLLSDLLLHFLYSYSLFGFWTFFNYSALAAIVCLGRKLAQKHSHHYLFYIVGSSVGFWLWTNLGTFLTGLLYPLTLSGFLNCYIKALPFLRNQLFGDFIWGVTVFSGLQALLHKSPVLSSRAKARDPGKR